MQHRDNTRPKGGLRSTFLRHVRRQQAGNGDNQSGVARDQSLVPQTPSSSVFGPGSQNNIGGGEFNNHQGDQTYVAVHIHKSGVVNTSVDEFQGTSEGIDQTNLEDKTYRPSGNKPVFRTDPMPPDKEPTPHNTVSTQKSQRSNQLYELYLMRKGRGYPLWIPQANMRLPKPYRATGVSIGDVGFITPSGGFDFLFNICLPCDNPINPNQLPMNFTPIHPPLHPSEIREFPEFSSGSYLASSSIAMSQTESQTLEMVFESSASEGAILTMPHGAYQEELRNVARFRDYITTHAEDWYRHVNLTHGCENGDLHLVVGSDKSTSWGMATFKNASRREKFHLKFQPLGTDNWLSSRTTCIWKHSGMADVRSGPDVGEIHELGATPDNPLRNQCLFLRTLSISLSSTAWEKVTQKVKVTENGLGKYNVYGSDTTAPPSVDQQGENSTASDNRYPINNAHEGQSRGRNVLLVDPFPSLANPHPSKVVNDFILAQQPTAVVAVADDRDWQYIKAGGIDFPATSDFLDRISALNDACVSNGAAYLQLKGPGILDQNDEKEKLAYLKRGFKSNQDTMTLDRYLFGNSEIYSQDLLVFCETLKTTFHPYQDHLEEISQQIPSSLIDCHYRMLPLDDLLSLVRDSDYLDIDTSRENAISSHHCLFTNHPTDDRSMSVQKPRMKAAYGFSQRYYRLKHEDDLEEAIALLQDVLVDAPIEHYLYLDALLALAPLLHKRYLIKGVPQDLLSLVENLEIQAKLDFKALLHPFEQQLANSIPPESSDTSEAASQSISKEFVSAIRSRLDGVGPNRWLSSVRALRRELDAVSFLLRSFSRPTKLFRWFSSARSASTRPVRNTPETVEENGHQGVARAVGKRGVQLGALSPYHPTTIPWPGPDSPVFFPRRISSCLIKLFQWFSSVRVVAGAWDTVSFLLRLFSRPIEPSRWFPSVGWDGEGRGVDRQTQVQRKALRRALLIGINLASPERPFRNTLEATGGNCIQEVLNNGWVDGQKALKGPQKDAWDLSRLLIDVYGYDESEITVLIDDDIPEHVQPTRDNVIQKMKDLVRDAAEGDQFFFHLVGQSTHYNDTREEDGRGKLFITSDGQLIMDDDLNEYLVLPAGSSLVAVFDCGHSGTPLDLPHIHCNRVYVPWVRVGMSRWPPSRPPSGPPSRPSSRPSSRPCSRPPSRPSSRPSSRPCSRPPSRPSSRPSSRPRSRPPSWNCSTLASPASPVSARPTAYFRLPKSMSCTGWCRQAPPLMFADDQSPFEADVVALSAAEAGQRSWEDEEGKSMTQALIRILRENREPSLENLLTLVSHELYRSYLDKARGHVDNVRITNRNRRLSAQSPYRAGSRMAVNDHSLQISSVYPLDMKRLWKI